MGKRIFRLPFFFFKELAETVSSKDGLFQMVKILFGDVIAR